MEGRHHGVVYAALGDVAVLVVMADKKQHSQSNRLCNGVRLKRYAAVILGNGLSLPDEGFQVGILVIILDTQMGLDLINRKNQGASPASDAASTPLSRSTARR